MANYDNKLGEWFKQVEQREKELKDKRRSAEPDPNPEHAPAQQVDQVMAIEIESAASQSQPDPAVVESREVVARAVVAEISRPEPESEPEPHQLPQRRSTPSLFEDSDAPAVEDFFSFLSRSTEIQRPAVEEPETVEEPEDFDELDDFDAIEEADDEIEEIEEVVEEPVVETAPLPPSMIEGTGEPRPILTPEPEPPAAPVQRAEPVAEQPRAQAPIEVQPRPIPTPVVAPHPIEEHEVKPAATVQEKWDKVPHHLQTLFGSESEEVAQHSYKAFKESRGELIQRLLDPPITLEEAARVLNVCPTTVRRYTNRGTLKHYRTAGNQRRFRLSDVLAFMEDKPGKG